MNAVRDEAQLFVPGRLCLFGEHSDWASEHGIHKGYCLLIGTDQGLSAAARPSDAFCVETLIPDTNGRPTGRTRRMTCDWDTDTLRAAAEDKDEFFRYCAGVACELAQRKGVDGGIELRITAMDLPLKKGVSSSAAVSMIVARAFDVVYGLDLFPHELMEIAYRGEILTGSRCGRMDQACVFGKTPVLLSFPGAGDVRVEPVFPQAEIPMFFVDLAGKKDTVKILADLQSAYPRSQDLQEALGTENERIIRQAYRALTGGDAERLGTLMSEAQDVFDRLVAPHSPDELASPLLHKVLSFSEIAANVYGGKGVGSQGDGTAQFVARSIDDRDEAMDKVSRAFPQMQCFPLTIPPQAPRPTRSSSE